MDLIDTLYHHAFFAAVAFVLVFGGGGWLAWLYIAGVRTKSVWALALFLAVVLGFLTCSWLLLVGFYTYSSSTNKLILQWVVGVLDTIGALYLSVRFLDWARPKSNS